LGYRLLYCCLLCLDPFKEFRDCSLDVDCFLRTLCLNALRQGTQLCDELGVCRMGLEKVGDLEALRVSHLSREISSEEVGIEKSVSR
jgi:hypothetical protein